MKTFQGKTLSWNWTDGVIELTLDSAPCNEIGSATLPELERFVEALAKLQNESHALIISSARKEGFLRRGGSPGVVPRIAATGPERTRSPSAGFSGTHSPGDECD
jgi:hypothetical protein